MTQTVRIYFNGFKFHVCGRLATSITVVPGLLDTSACRQITLLYYKVERSLAVIHGHSSVNNDGIMMLKLPLVMTLSPHTLLFVLGSKSPYCTIGQTGVH